MRCLINTLGMNPTPSDPNYGVLNNTYLDKFAKEDHRNICRLSIP